MLGLLLEGLPNKLIARRLEITEKTVKSHLTRIFREIGVTDRTQAALWAERHGLGPGARPALSGIRAARPLAGRFRPAGGTAQPHRVGPKSHCGLDRHASPFRIQWPRRMELIPARDRPSPGSSVSCPSRSRPRCSRSSSLGPAAALARAAAAAAVAAVAAAATAPRSASRAPAAAARRRRSSSRPATAGSRPSSRSTAAPARLARRVRPGARASSGAAAPARVGPSHSFSIERRLSDYPGPDQVTARAVGPRGITCQATATLPG